MNFRVFDKSGNDITKNECWVITSEGEIRYLRYDDLIGIDGVKAVIYFDDGHIIGNGNTIMFKVQEFYCKDTPVDAGYS